MGVLMDMPNKTVKEYRWLAQKCRETARMAERTSERTRLLVMAQTWELLADRRQERGPATAIGPHL